MSGATTMMALPMPDAEIRLGLRSTATTSNTNNSKIGTSKNVLNDTDGALALKSLIINFQRYSIAIIQTASQHGFAHFSRLD
jgi:hypothetical protein